ncbi:MAG: hypothetical protein U1F61_17800 [Opitutaceae bacterium]
MTPSVLHSVAVPTHAPTRLGGSGRHLRTALGLLGLLGACCLPVLGAEPKSRVATTSDSSPTSKQDSDAVLLPPFLVEHESLPTWRYVRVAGMEILTRCSTSLTSELVSQFHSLHALLEVIVPARHQFRTDVPFVYVFIDQLSEDARAREMLELQRDGETTLERNRTGATASSAPRYELLPNFRFWDQDSVAVYYMANPFERGGLALSPGYVRFLLEHRTPALPRWYIEGVLDLYDQTLFVPPPIKGLDMFESIGASRLDPVGENLVKLLPLVWINPEVSKTLTEASAERFDQKMLQSKATPFPLADVMRQPPPERNSPAYARWRATAALFLRLLLTPPDHPLTWQFAGGTSERALEQWIQVACEADSPPEEAFARCFGRDFREADRVLRDQLPVLLHRKTPRILRPDQVEKLPEADLQLATESEISRAKGTLSRLEIAYVREVAPQLTETYVRRARVTLRKAYANGDRNPRLLAELGLCECDAGDDDAAKPFLEAAVQAGAVHPRVYYEAARLRFRPKKPGAIRSPLSPKETARVLEPIRLGSTQEPRLAESFELAAQVWLASAATPDEADLAFLLDGTRRYPRRPRLLLGTALVFAAQGRVADASRLVDRGMTITQDSDERARFLRLHLVLQGQR